VALVTERPRIDVRVLGGLALRIHPRPGLAVAEGRLPFLGPREERSTRIALAMEELA